MAINNIPIPYNIHTTYLLITSIGEIHSAESLEIGATAAYPTSFQATGRYPDHGTIVQAERVEDFLPTGIIWVIFICFLDFSLIYSQGEFYFIAIGWT